MSATWKLASPKWDFDGATYDRTALSFDNDDHVHIVIHNYRWRLQLASGDQRCALLEHELQQYPEIGVPSITIGSDFDGAGAGGARYRAQFTGQYAHRTLPGIGITFPLGVTSVNRRRFRVRRQTRQEAARTPVEKVSKARLLQEARY